MIGDGCPWCGEEPEPWANTPRLFDRWLEAHVAECEPYLAEQGGAS